jgi:hypothetical protein
VAVFSHIVGGRIYKRAEAFKIVALGHFDGGNMERPEKHESLKIISSADRFISGNKGNLKS